MVGGEEKKPRARRRGRARGQKAGGMLANLHGRDIIIVEDEVKPVRKKPPAVRQKKECRPLPDGKAVMESCGGGEGPSHDGTELVRPKEMKEDAPMFQEKPSSTGALSTSEKELPLRVGKEAESQVQWKSIAVKEHTGPECQPKASKSAPDGMIGSPTQCTKTTLKAPASPQTEKENRYQHNSYNSPVYAEQPLTESPSPTPPMTSIKMKTNSKAHGDHNLLLSPLSPMTTCNDVVSPASSAKDDCSDSDSSTDQSSVNSSDAEEESEASSSPESDGMSDGNKSDESSMNSIERSRTDAETSDMEERCDQSYGDDNEDDEAIIYQGESETEDEDYSIEGDNSDSDDDLEFDDESEKKQVRKGRKKKAADDASVRDTCEKDDCSESTEEENELRSSYIAEEEEMSTESDVQESRDQSTEEESGGRSCVAEEESQMSSRKHLKGCKVKLNDILGDEERSPKVVPIEQLLVDEQKERAESEDLQIKCTQELAQQEPYFDTTPTKSITSNIIVAKSNIHIFAKNEPINENRENTCPEAREDAQYNSSKQQTEKTLPQQPCSEQSPAKKSALNSVITERKPSNPVQPSTSELYDVVDCLFHAADIDKVTVKDIVRSVANHFGMPKVEKPMKKMIKARLTDLIEGNIEPEKVWDDEYADVHEEVGEPSSDEADGPSKKKEAELDEKSLHKSSVAELTERDIVQEDEVDCDESLKSSHSAAELSFAGADTSYVIDEDDVIHDGNADGDNSNISAADGDDVLCPPATSISDPNMPSYPASETPSQKEENKQCPAESDVRPITRHDTPPARAPSIAEEMTDDISVLSGALFQNLSPDLSVKSKTSSGEQNILSNLMDSMSMSNSFGDSMKSRNIVEKGKWSLGSEIGVGSFGRVYMGMNALNGSMMAVKVLQIQGDNKHAIVEDLQREIDLMKSLKHPNIVRYLGAEVDNSKNILHIFQEWAPGGSIASLLKKFGPFPITVVKSYLSQILKGLDYLHHNGIIHRDIKGGNILVSNDGSIKLADFGASKRVEAFGAESDEMELTMRGTPYFMAPEVFEEKYGSRADIWSVGGVIYQMVTGSPPWKGMGFKSPMALFMHLKRDDSPPKLPQLKNYEDYEYSLLESILARCFQREPSMRPSASALMRDKFLNNNTAPPPKSPNLTIQIAIKDHPSPSSPCGADFVQSPKPTFKSPLNQISENEALNSSTLSDSLCYSLTLKSPLPIVSINETPESTEWPDWAKKRNKENDIKTNPFAKNTNKGANPFKKAPFATTNLNIQPRNAI